MFNRAYAARIRAKIKNTTEKISKPVPKTVVVEEKVKEIEKVVNPQSKNVYAFVDNKCVGIYDSITLCATTLGLSRAMVKRAIENGVTLDNGFTLKLTNK